MPQIQEKHCSPCAGQPGCTECSSPVVCVCAYLLGDTDLAGPVNPTQERSLWQYVALSWEALLDLVWLMVTVLGITLHSFPRGRVVHGCKPPQVHVQPHFHPLHLGQLHRRGLGRRQVFSPGKERDTRVLALACSATFYHTEKRDNKKFPSVC